MPLSRIQLYQGSPVPSSATATGTAGQIAYDNASGFFYVATAANTWKRTQLSTWVPFVPTSLTGLHLWLDASDSSSLYDATSGGSIVATNGSVARWQDKSGNARHATQSSSGNRPTLQINGTGQRVVRFDGLATFLRTSSTFADSSDFSMFFTSAYGVGRGIDGSGSGWSVSFSGGVVAGGQYVAAPASPQTRGIFSLVWRNGQSLGALSNGVMSYAQTSLSGLRNSSEAWDIGRQGSATGWVPVDAREIVIYERALSDAEVTTVVNYLADKWSTG